MYLYISFLKYLNKPELIPPKTSMYSVSNLKGAFSNLVAGAFDKKNPKSIWIKNPLLLNKILPLCLSLTF